LLCIGDAAHAMSPAGGVGINLAIQDAVAAARLLASPLLCKSVDDALLRSVQARREFPTKVTQFVQTNAHRAFGWVFRNPGPIKAPVPFRILVRIPGLPRVLGRMVAIGVRPEHLADAPPPPKRPGLVCAALFATGAVVAITGLVLYRALRNH
jgi:2-polyprenyl-6-methoxyphenol hydroxylase-like FAD-dependent oxidoreductase